MYDITAFDFNHRIIRCKSAFNVKNRQRAFELARKSLNDRHVWYVSVDAIDGTYHHEFCVRDIL